MAYTYGQLVRRECGDKGIFGRELFSGDAATLAFYLKAGAILGDTSTYAVRVGGTLKTETSEYTLDKETGELVMASAPAAGTDNLAVTFRAVELSDGDITEALRQRGLVSTDTAATGPAAALLLAAADLADWRWSWWASAYDIMEDGESLSRSQAANSWHNKAEALRAKARTASGIVSTSIVRIDGYNLDEVPSRDVRNTARNPRQRFYYVGALDYYP